MMNANLFFIIRFDFWRQVKIPEGPLMLAGLPGIKTNRKTRRSWMEHL